MIEIIQHGSVHEIKLARPPVNALNFDLLDALVIAIQEAPGNGARGLILSGGEKVFSGGLDVPYLMTLDKEGLLKCWKRFFDAARALANSPVPVVAAIAGHNPAAIWPGRKARPARPRPLPSIRPHCRREVARDRYPCGARLPLRDSTQFLQSVIQTA